MLIADVDGKSGQTAAVDLPRVVLLGKDCADEPPDRSPVGEDAHHVSPALGLLVEALLRVVRPDLPPVGHGEGSEGEDIRAHVDQQFGGLEEAFVEHAHHGAVFSGVPPWATAADRPSSRWSPPRVGAARDLEEQVGHEVGAAALPWGPGEDRGGGVLQPPMDIGGHQIRLALAPPLSGPYRATAHASPHSPARALARGAYQRPRGIAHTGMGNARMQGQQSQGRTVEGMAIFGGRPAVSIPPSGGGGLPQRAFAGGHRYQGPFAAAKRPLWRFSRNVNCGVDQPPATKARNITRCIGQRAFGRRGHLLLGL